MHANPSLNEVKKEWHGTLKSYLWGFFLCLFLTSLSFLLVIEKAFSADVLLYTISGLALIQAIVQLVFLLHLGQEAKPKWMMLIFGFMVLILLIIVFGTIWIMNDLNERMMPAMSKEMTHD